MKNLLILFFLGLLSIPATSQYVYVLKVKGEILVEGKPLKVKDKISHNSQLLFSTSEDMAHVLYPGKGYYVLTQSKEKVRANEFLISLKEAMIPPKQYYKTSTRSTGNDDLVMEDIYDLKAFFRGDLFAIDELSVAIKPHTLLKNEGDYFSYKKGGQKFKVDISDNSINWHPEIAKSDEAISLFYHTNDESVLIGTFSITFIDKDYLTKEIALFTSNLSSLHGYQLESEVLSYVHHAYGKTNPAAIKRLVDQLSADQHH